MLIWNKFLSFKELPTRTNTAEVVDRCLLIYGKWNTGQSRLILIYNMVPPTIEEESILPKQWLCDGLEPFVETLKNTTWLFWTDITKHLPFDE